MKNYNDMTTIRVNKEKKELAKAKGYLLQDLLDNALDSVLSLEYANATDLVKEKDTILEEIKEIQKTIDTIEMEKNQLINECQIKIDKLNIKIKAIDSEIENGKLTHLKNKEYEEIDKLFVDNYCDFNEEIEAKISAYCTIYDLDKIEFENNLIDKHRVN